MYLYKVNDKIPIVNKAVAWLKQKREERALSFRELAEKVGLSHGTIANAEEGMATERTWITLAEFFEEDPQTVLHWAGKAEPPPTEQQKEWAERMYRRLERLPPDLRDIAESLINTLYEKEQQKKKNKVVTK